MAANHVEARMIPASVNAVIQTVRSISYSKLGITYLNEYAIPNGVVANLSHNVSLSSWGENIRVTITAQGESSFVEIYSECSLPTQIVDWGKNGQNIVKIFNYIVQNVYMYQQSAYQPQQNPNVCPVCGYGIDSTCTFCPSCGTKIK
jgi:hypothetical protein